MGRRRATAEALGQTSQTYAWYSLWSHVAGYPDQFMQWAYMTADTARHIGRVMRGQPLASDFEHYRLLGPVVSGWSWYPVQGTAWGAWGAAKHVGWIYTSGAGYMRLSAALARQAGDMTLVRDTQMRIMT